MRALRYIGLLLAVLVLFAVAAWYWALHTSSGARWIVAKAGAAAGVQVETVDGDIGSGLALGGLRFANESVHVSIRSATVAVDVDLMPPSVDVTRARASLVDIVFAEAEQAPAAGTTDIAEVLGSLVLPVPVRVSDLSVDGITVTTAGAAQQIDRVGLVAAWHENIVVERLRISMMGIDAELSGALALLHGNALHADVRADLPPDVTGLSDVLAVYARGSGDPNGIDVQATVGTFASIIGDVRWQDELAANAEIVLEGFDLAGAAENWPAGFPVSGTIHAAVDEQHIVVRDSALEIVGTPSRVLVNASLDRSNNDVDGQLRWESLRWPLPEAEMRVRSDTGDIRLQGTRDSWTVSGMIAVGGEGIPDGIFQVDASGSPRGIEGRIVDSEVFGGRIAGEAAFAFDNGRPWSADLVVERVDLSLLFPEWPTVVSGHVDSRGTVEPFALRAVLRDVEGESRGAPLAANGAVDIVNGDFVADRLQIAHGESAFLLDGALSRPEGLSVEARIGDIGDYVENAAGALSGQGRAYVAGDDAALAVQAGSDFLSVAGFEFHELRATLDATDDAQSLRIDGTHLGAGFAVALAGAFDDWRRPLETPFNGLIEDFRIDLGDEHTMILTGGAPLEASTRHISLRTFCIADQTGSTLCADAGWQASGDAFARLELTEVPVTLVEHVARTGLVLDQHVSGSVEWLYAQDSGMTGSGRLQLSPGTVTSAEDAALSVATGDGRVGFVIEDGTLLSADLELPMPGTGVVNGQFALHEVDKLAESSISGSLEADISDITILSMLTPMIDAASGQLQGNAQLGGTLVSPTVDGEVALTDASLVYRPIGLKLTDVNLTANVDEQFRADLQGTFRAGNGFGEIMSSADYSDADQPGLRFRLRGDDLLLVNVPDVRVAADTDIGIAVVRDTMTINGKVTIPDALVKPTNLSATKVTESNDVVIVAGELPDQREEPQTADGFRYEGSLEVALGDNVVVDLDIARATVNGAVSFDWQGDPMPIADGRYSIQGSIEALGQVLNISEGAVNFPKVPADRPFIRIIAEREIFGNTQIKRAGVLVDGPLARPTVEAFTVPLTTEERALALLVTGSDFDYEQGVGALDFGAYIAPRLFLSYGIGVFERENIISARFDLNESFGIKASSGSKESGVDLNYRLEN